MGTSSHQCNGRPSSVPSSCGARSVGAQSHRAAPSCLPAASARCRKDDEDGSLALPSVSSRPGSAVLLPVGARARPKCPPADSAGPPGSLLQTLFLSATRFSLNTRIVKERVCLRMCRGHTRPNPNAAFLPVAFDNSVTCSNATSQAFPALKIEAPSARSAACVTQLFKAPGKVLAGYPFEAHHVEMKPMRQVSGHNLDFGSHSKRRVNHSNLGFTW